MVFYYGSPRQLRQMFYLLKALISLFLGSGKIFGYISKSDIFLGDILKFLISLVFGKKDAC